MRSVCSLRCLSQSCTVCKHSLDPLSHYFTRSLMRFLRFFFLFSFLSFFFSFQFFPFLALSLSFSLDIFCLPSSPYFCQFFTAVKKGENRRLFNYKQSNQGISIKMMQMKEKMSVKEKYIANSMKSENIRKD